MTIRRYFHSDCARATSIQSTAFQFSSNLEVIRRSQRFAKASTALETESEYLINVTRWSPLGRTVKREMINASQLI